MRFVVDAQLPPALARWLAGQGHDALHVVDVGLHEASDRAIWNYAVSTDAVIVTKDEDFAVRRATSEGPQILWVRVGNTRRATLLAWFAGVLSRAVAALDEGTGVVEMRA